MQGNQFVDAVFAIQNCQLGLTRGGKPYIKCLLADRSGRVPARMWNTSEELFATLPTDGFVYVSGQTQPYQGEMQIIIQQIEAVEPNADDLLELLPCSPFDPDKMFAELSEILGTLSHPGIAALAQAYLGDAELMAKFRRAPAAMSLHHAYLAGLLEHTLSLLKLAKSVLPLYPHLNADIVLMGLFIHDLGKCCELTWERGFGYSDDGQLVGHIARGVIVLDQKLQQVAAAGTPVPEPVALVLHHIILSHHGKPEFGALKLPATPEAIAVSMLDNVDAKLHMALAAASRGEPNKDAALGGHFTEKVWALETRIYRPDPTTLQPLTPGTAPTPVAAPAARPAPAAPASAPPRPAANNPPPPPRRPERQPNLKGGI
jgi:3'-5' exoribonuclease